MSDIGDLTAPQLILLAAEKLKLAGESPFSAERLVVVAWDMAKGTFGLKGYAETYPDSNKVLSGLMGERGIVRRGLLVKTGKKMYALSRAGQQFVNKFMDRPQRAEEKVRLSAQQDAFLTRLLESNAVCANGNQNASFLDACRFWGIEAARGEDVYRIIGEINAILVGIAGLLVPADTELRNGRVVTDADTRKLVSISRTMMNRFKTHIKLMASRAH